MRKHIRSIKAKKSGRTVGDFEIEWPKNEAAWLKESGYDVPALMQLAYEGWIVKEGAPEVRALLEKGEVSKTKAIKVLEARVKAGWRERQASPREQRLREAGATEEQIANWKEVQKLLG